MPRFGFHKCEKFYKTFEVDENYLVQNEKVTLRTEPPRSIETQTDDNLNEQLNTLTLENEKYKKRLNQLIATAQREIKNLKSSRDQYRQKCENYEKSRRRHYETPVYLFDIFCNKYGYANATHLSGIGDYCRTY